MGTQHIITIADFFELFSNSEILTNVYDLVLLDPDYNELDDIEKAISISLYHLRKPGGAVLCFMYPEDIPQGMLKPDQVCHWIKPQNSRNTKKRYSRFVEAICVWQGDYFNQELNPANRTGIFRDTLIRKHKHPYRKPYSLIEKLILLHCPIGGNMIDPFAGTFVSNEVCEKYGINSLCIDKVDWREHV